MAAERLRGCAVNGKGMFQGIVGSARKIIEDETFDPVFRMVGRLLVVIGGIFAGWLLLKLLVMVVAG